MGGSLGRERGDHTSMTWNSTTLPNVEHMAITQQKMRAAFLPGNDKVELRTLPIPRPAHGEVLLRIKASTICGSDIRCIYHEHLGKGPEGYQGVVAGHEPSGQIVEVGPGCRRFAVGNRVIVYHISGCGVCNDCRRGYMISCTSEKYRRAYGWQRDGGMADYMIAEEKDLIALPDELSYADGAQVACGFGTVYEALEKIGINGNHSVLITGLGPVGLAAAALCRKLGAHMIIGVDVVPERLELARSLRLCDFVLGSGPDNDALIDAALQHGALAAKLAGAGGGGTIIALHPDPVWLGSRLSEAGADRILYPVVTEGVRVERPAEVGGR